MMRKKLVLGTALTLTAAALLALPAWLAATESPAVEATTAEHPSRGFLGVGLRELTPELQSHFGAPEGSGVLVASVDDGSPAAAAGVRVGDVITAVDGLAVDSARELSREIRHRPGDAVAIELYRDGSARQVTVTLGERRAWARDQRGVSPQDWAAFAERWARWGEEFGEKWGEEHAAEWQSWAEEMAERGEGWEEIGQEIGQTVEKALSEVDWDEIGKAVEQSMKSLEEIDWDGMSEQIEQRMEELEKRLEELHEADFDSD